MSRVRLGAIAALLATAVAVTAACFGTTDRTSKAAGLANRTFVSESVTDKGAPRPLAAGTRITIDFRRDALDASAGCNSMGGVFNLEGDRLVLDEITSTAMGCGRELHDQDDLVWGLLDSKPAFDLDGSRLTMSGDGLTVELVDRREADPDRPLRGTVWKVESLLDRDGASAATAPATVRFPRDREAVEFTACNTGGADVRIGNDDIQFERLMATKKACPGSGLQAVEDAINAVLQGTASYSVEADELTLKNEATGRGLVLRAQ